MKKLLAKLSSTLLAIAMVISMVPTTAYAATRFIYTVGDSTYTGTSVKVLSYADVMENLGSTAEETDIAKFLGWSDNAEATYANYVAGTTYTSASGVTVYPVFASEEFDGYQDQGYSGTNSTYKSSCHARYDKFVLVKSNGNGGYETIGSYTMLEKVKTGSTSASSNSVTLPTYDAEDVSVVYSSVLGDYNVDSVSGWYTSTDDFESGTAVTKYTSKIANANESSTFYALVELVNHTVIFAGDGVSFDAATVEDKGTLSLSSYIPTRDGYIFAGWDTDDDGEANYTSEDTITVTSDMTLTAVWEAEEVTCTITYVYEDGTTEEQSVTSGEGILIEKTAEKTGYDFVGWNTKENATYATYFYEDGNYFTITEDLTLYPVFTEQIEAAYTFTSSIKNSRKGIYPTYSYIIYQIYHKNDPTSSEDETYVVKNVLKSSDLAKNLYICYYDSDTYTGKYNCSFSVPDGYEFEGWNSSTDGSGTSYTEYSQTSFSAEGTNNYDLYATYDKLTSEYTITYMVEGEVYATDTVEEGASYTIEKTASKEGYDFLGWNDTDGQIYANYLVSRNTYTFDQDITLYAVFYEQIEADVTLSPSLYSSSQNYRQYYYVRYIIFHKNDPTSEEDETFTIKQFAEGKTLGLSRRTNYYNNSEAGEQYNCGFNVPDGYTFNSWNTASDGNGTSYAEYTDYATFYAGKNDLYATYDSTEDDGTEDDGTEDDGTEDDGTADDGTEDDGTEDDGTEDDGTEDDGTEDDGIEDDGTEDDGIEDDGTEDDGTEDDGTEDDGSTDDDGDAESEGPGVSGKPEKPVEPGQPSAPDAPAEPGLPQISELKVEEPSVPAVPGAPAVPEIPAEPVTYTVTYKVGDTEISSASYLAGEMATVEYYYGELTKDYTFDGWEVVDSDGNATGTVYKEGDIFEVTSDVTLVAKWSEVVVEEVGPAEPSAPDAPAEPVLPQIPELNVEEPAAPAVPEIPAEPVTYTVTYKVGDTEISSASYLEGETVTVEYYYGELVKEYTFAGWQAVDSDGNATGKVYAEGDTFVVNSDVILVAVWSEVVVETVEPEVLPEESAEAEGDVPAEPEPEEPKANYDDQVMPIPE